MRRLFCILLCLALLAATTIPVSTASESVPLSDRVEEFIYENGLDESNFALSFFNCATEEMYSFNADACFPAGNLWKLSLHMYYYEQETKGAFINPDKPNEIYTIDGMDLEECRYRSINLGEEDISVKMRNQIGSYEQFKLTVNEAFGHVPAEKLPDAFFRENVYSTRFWINSLIEIHHHGDNFQNMMRNFESVQTVDGLASYDKTYPMAHIRGEENGFISDVARVNVAKNYLLACSVSIEAGGDEILGKINTLVCSYVEETAVRNQPSGGNNLLRGQDAMTIVSGDRQDKTVAYRWVGFAVGGFLLLAAAIGIPCLLIIRRKRNEEIY